jgi:hypothetical protein
VLVLVLILLINEEQLLRTTSATRKHTSVTSSINTFSRSEILDRFPHQSRQSMTAAAHDRFLLDSIVKRRTAYGTRISRSYVLCSYFIQHSEEVCLLWSICHLGSRCTTGMPYAICSMCAAQRGSVPAQLFLRILSLSLRCQAGRQTDCSRSADRASASDGMA